MILEVAVGNGDISRPLNDINKAISAVREVAMVYPDVVRAEDIDAIPVRRTSAAIMWRRAPHIRRSCNLNVVDVNVVNDYVVHELKREASASGNVNIAATAVDGLVTVHDELLLQLNIHVAAEDYPERLAPNGAIAKRPLLRVNDIVVAVVCNNIYLPISATDGVLAEANGATSERLPIVGPI